MVFSLNRHLSKQESIPKEDIWGSKLPYDVFKYLLYFLPFREIARCSLVCKNWNRFAKDPAVGRRFLEPAAQKPKENESWIRAYSIWLNSNNLIFLDKSNSMHRLNASGGETWRLDTAIDRVKEIVSVLEPAIVNKGIQVTSFAKSSKTRWMQKIRDLTAFLSASDQFGSRSDLKDAIERTMKYYDSKKRKIEELPTNVYIVSDMGLTIALEDLTPIATDGNFRFIQVGNSPKGTQLLQDLQVEYNNLHQKRAPEFKLVFENIKEKKAKLEI